MSTLISKWEDKLAPGHITTNPMIAQGAPIVRGTEVLVVSVCVSLRNCSRLEASKTYAITRDQVDACVRYCRDHWPKFFIYVVSAEKVRKQA